MRDLITVRDMNGILRLYAAGTIFGYTGWDYKGRRIADLPDRDAAWKWAAQQATRLELPAPMAEEFL